MTQEEYQRAMAEAMKRQASGMPPITMQSQVENITSAPLSSGMASAYVDNAQAAVAQRDAEARAKSLAGREGKIKSQRDYANSLRGKAAPQGMTAGPLDVYYGPNIGQSLEYAGNQMLGGYMAGRANEGDIALDEERGLIKSAEQAEERSRYDTKIEMDERTLSGAEASRLANQEWREEQAAATLLRETSRIAAAKAAAAESLRRDNAAQAVIAERFKRSDEKNETAALKVTNKGVRDYGTAVRKSGIPVATSQMSQLTSLIGDYAEQDKNGEWVLKEGVTEIPGIGGWSNAPFVIGEAVTWLADADRDNEEIDGIGKSIKQTAQKMYNTEIKDTSGAAVSAHEMVRNLRSQGTDMFSDANSFLIGINTIQGGYNAQQKAIDAETDPEYISIYNERIAEKMAPSEEEVTEDIIIETGDYAGMIQRADGRVYDENGIAIARWK